MKYKIWIDTDLVGNKPYETEVCTEVELDDNLPEEEVEEILFNGMLQLFEWGYKKIDKCCEKTHRTELNITNIIVDRKGFPISIVIEDETGNKAIYDKRDKIDENNKKALLDILEDMKGFANDTVHSNCEYYIYSTLMDYIYDLEREIEK